MNKRQLSLRVFLFATFTLALASLAQAQATRTWVSGVGDDVNPCSRTAPCKTWAGAISKTATNGEINALDPGGFGTLTTTKSITVDGTNGQGFGSTINAGGINGFIINDSLAAAPNTAVVRLRNLSINGAGTSVGLNGIRFVAGKSLHVENVVIDNQSGDGVLVNPTAAGIAHEVYMNNVTIRNVASDAVELSASGVGSLVLASIDNCSFSNSGNGVRAGANSRAHIRGAQIATTTGFGVSADTATAEVNVDNCMITNNPDGVKTNGGSARVSRSVISGNTNGLNNVSGTLKRFNNNMIDGNTNNTLGVITPINEG